MKKVLKVAGIIMGILFVLIVAIWFIMTNFFLKINLPARKSEAKSCLASIATASITYFAEHNNWGCSFSQIGWAPSESKSKIKFIYFITPTEYIGKSPEKLNLAIPVDFAALNAPTPSCSAKGFTAVAIGNIDSDATLDVWYITRDKTPINVKNDFNE